LEKLDHIGLALGKLFLIRCGSDVQYLCSCMLDWFMVKRHVSVVAGTPQCTLCPHIICHVLPFIIIVKLASLLFFIQCPHYFAWHIFYFPGYQINLGNPVAYLFDNIYIWQYVPLHESIRGLIRHFGMVRIPDVLINNVILCLLPSCVFPFTNHDYDT
jgi:hypothetical protein